MITIIHLSSFCDLSKLMPQKLDKKVATISEKVFLVFMFFFNLSFFVGYNYQNSSKCSFP